MIMLRPPQEDHRALPKEADEEVTKVKVSNKKKAPPSSFWGYIFGTLWSMIKMIVFVGGGLKGAHVLFSALQGIIPLRQKILSQTSPALLLLNPYLEHQICVGVK